MTNEQEKARILMKSLYLSTKTNSKRYISPIDLRQMYRKYSEWRQLVKSRKDWWSKKNEKTKVHEFDRYFVHYLLERCFWVSYGDSDVVSDLLSILYETDGHLGKIFYGHALPVRPLHSKKNLPECKDEVLTSKYLLNSTWSMGFLQKQNVIDYFIKHATKNKVLFEHLRFGEQWILNYKMKTLSGSTDLLFHTPCSLFFTAPDILSTLLEHGLFANTDPRDENVGRLLTGIIGIWATGGLNNSISQNTTSVLEVAAMLLRAVKSVDISVLLVYQRVRRRPMTISNIVNKVSTENVLPMLRTRCFGPQELQHLCRWQIRKQLYGNWKLPEGIAFLPVPKCFQQYLHLRRD